MYYLIVAILFLKPSIRREHFPAQIGRFIFGLIISFLFFYLCNADRSISFIFSILWLPALFQIILSIKNFAKSTGNYKKTKVRQEYRSSNFQSIFTMLMIFTIIFCLVYNSQPYITGQAKNLATIVPVKESTDKLPKIDAEHVIVISPETAYYEMQKMIGTLPNPSIYKIGELGITMTKEGACYVAPIEVDGGFVSLTNSSIPGVMYVSAEKPMEARIINISTKVADSLSFNHNLERYLRKYEPSKILFQANTELDDDGNPYFVGSYGHYKYGRKGAVVEGVMLMSFKDGKVTDYKLDKVPNWVDEVYPSDIAEDYNEYFGTLANGLLNKIFAKNGVHIPTQWSSEANVNGLEVNSREVTGVIDADGKMKWFTDHTNTSSSSTTMTGYTLMDMRTGNMIYYKTSGYINGKGAINAVDKTMGANKSNWAPVQPIFYNLFGTEAWVVPVVNKTDGALVKVAIVAAQNGYTVLEDSKASALEAFKNAIAYGKVQDISNKNANSVKAEEKTITGKVSRINEVFEEGNTIFYLKLENDKKIYMVTKAAGVDIVLTKEGDPVEIKYLDIRDNDIVSTTQIVNNNIK